MNHRNKTRPRLIDWLRQRHLFRSEALFVNAIFMVPTTLLLTYLAVDVGLSTYQSCTSGGRSAVVQTIGNDSTLMQALGSIEKTRCLFGTGYSDADYATGNLWLTIRGADDEGMLYARYMMNKGIWWLTTARMDLRHSGQFFIEGQRPELAAKANDSRLRVDTMEEDDHPLKGDRSSVDRWRSVSWPEQRIDLDVPAEWRLTRRTDEELYLYSSTSDLYFIATFRPALDMNITLRFMNELRRKERSWWNIARARPSVFSNIGNLKGYIRWPGRGAKSVGWFGVRKHPELGDQRVEFLFGASSNTLFEANRPIFGAVLESIRTHD